jgi:hypothetical protein
MSRLVDALKRLDTPRAEGDPRDERIAPPDIVDRTDVACAQLVDLLDSEFERCWGESSTCSKSEDPAHWGSVPQHRIPVARVSSPPESRKSEPAEFGRRNEVVPNAPEPAESHFAAMAANIQAQLPAVGSTSLFLTSPLDGVGKSELIVPLAEALVACTGRRTIMVDGNLHSPSLTREWRFSSRRGLYEVLIGEADWWEAVQETG